MSDVGPSIDLNVAPPTARSGARRVDSGAVLHGEVLARLRDHIVEGSLSAGARIPERELCEMLGISRTPLREALKVLAAEGLVDLLPNRGARVRNLSEEDIRQLFDLVAGLEALAGRLACELITDEEVAEIESLHHQMYAFYLRQNLPEYFDLNQLIHQKIIAAAGNSALAATYAVYTSQIRRVRYAANLARNKQRWSEAMREHEAILDALRRRAGLELSDILFCHMRNKQTAAISQLPEGSDA